MEQYTIETHDLDFYFKDFKALDGINLSVPQGSIFGFLGPNGAGKTTTIRVLLDLFHANHGNIEIFGKPLKAHKTEILGRVGALIENPSIYKHLSGRQNLEIIRRMLNAPKSRIDEVLKIVRLTDNADKKAKHYSLGMCQRLGLAAALLTNPDLLILDEPTNGLDPSGIIEMRELILELNQQHNKTIFLSSHLLSEIEKLATDVAIVDSGKILYQGNLEGLKAQKQGIELKIEVGDTDKAAQVLKQLNFTISESTPSYVKAHISSKEDVARINTTLVQNDLDVYQLTSSNENLEEIFLTLTKRLDQ